MAQFIYYGRNGLGEKVQGKVDRNDKNAVAEYLHQQHITPINITVDSQSDNFVKYALKSKALLSKKVSDEELVMFCRQMHTINKAGLPIAQGMKSLSMSMPKGVLKEAISDVVTRLESGTSLSLALHLYPKIFDSLFINLVKVGEDSGNLDKVFLQLALYIERDVETKKAIKAAVRYPSFVVSAMALALVVINIYVIPAFGSMFSRFDAELPIATRMLIGLSNFFVNYWLALLIMFVGVSCFLVYWLRTDIGRLLWDKQKLSLPIVGGLIKKASLARYTRSFSVMLQAGVPLSDAIGLCAKVIHNYFLEKQIDNIKLGVQRGESLMLTHSRTGIFTPLILQMINVGESSGQVDTLLIDVADHYDKEVAYDLKSLSSKIEPILIVVMSVFVLILALGIFLPMWEMYNIQK